MFLIRLEPLIDSTREQGVRSCRMECYLGDSLSLGSDLITGGLPYFTSHQTTYQIRISILLLHYPILPFILSLALRIAHPRTQQGALSVHSGKARGNSQVVNDEQQQPSSNRSFKEAIHHNRKYSFYCRRYLLACSF